jgi:hypothetical protein
MLLAIPMRWIVLAAWTLLMLALWWRGERWSNVTLIAVCIVAVGLIYSFAWLELP